jgi:hypothetical protein
MSNPSKLLRELAEKIADPGELATEHYNQLTPDQQVMWNEQLRYREAVRVKRDDVRTAEHEVCDLIAQGVSPIRARKQLKGHGFFMPDSGEYVLWLDATVEQHEMRASYLRRMAQGILRTVEMHEQAIADITAAGVTTLAELEDAA